MSKYNEFAKKLDAAFKEARQIFLDEHDRLERAREIAKKNLGDQALRDWQKTEEKERLTAAEHRFADTTKAAWDALATKRDELTRELRAAVEHDQLADPGAVDAATVTLLQSGVLKAADFRALAEKFDGNATMRRLLQRSAEEAAQKAKGDTTERAALMAVAERCKDATMENWATLTSIMEHCSGGRPGYKGTANFVLTMSRSWEDFTRNAIESF